MLRAVIFDVDFTLSQPGPELGPEAYRRVGLAHGLDLDPGQYEEARLAAMEDLRSHPEFVHDEELWVTFTEDIVRGMGGDAAGARACAADMVRRWEIHENFHLYDDALPVIASLREHRLSIGLISNGQRDLEEFATHHQLRVDCAVGSKAHGRAKPHASIFECALSTLGVTVPEAVMVGDSVKDDIEGARALGMRAILVDRDDLYPGERDRITDLFQLPVALGLTAV
ncbi:HAD family hydrolase [Gaiella sp.]|uniref:HAD family hydrolase n=1 Tax=Gaiella sp. TaxID=2663207 RepID=UPI0032647F58